MTRRTRPRRTDVGTVVLHFALIGAVLVGAASGLRIAQAAGHFAPPAWLTWILPGDSLWLLHLLAGYGLVAVLTAYGVYVALTGLGRRIALDRARLAGLAAGGERRWQATSAILAWLMLAGLCALALTGTLFHFGGGAALSRIHLLLTYALFLLVPLHVAAHAAVGGVAQLLRVIRPAPEPLPTSGQMPERVEALVVKGLLPSLRVVLLAGAAVVGTGAAAAYFSAQRVARTDLRVVRIATGNDDLADPDLRSPLWAESRPIDVQTAMGANLGGTGASLVSIRAVHDGRTVWMAFTWEDPTRSVEQEPLVKTAAGWARASGPAGAVLEDQFAAMFSPGTGDFGPGAFHPGERPLPDRPPSASGKGLHFTRDGSTVDLWHWHASTGAALGGCGHDRFGPAALPTPAQLAGHAAYRGGMQPDPIETRAGPNRSGAPNDPAPLLRPLRLPLPGQRAEGALTTRNSVPFGQREDSLVPLGTVIPGIVVAGEPTSPKVACQARWSAGRWTLVARRSLDTGEPGDVPLRTGTSVWVAVFDQTVAGHTRHLRPLTLEIDP